MSLVDRDLFPLIDKETSPKAVVIVGARRTGKTTLLEVLAKKHESVRWYSGDDPTHSEELQLSSASDVELALMQAQALIIDEAQRIPNICLTLKRLVDANERLANPKKIYVTGSSSLDLAKGVKESAVGRLLMREMWPLSISEIAAFRSGEKFAKRLIGSLFTELIRMHSSILKMQVVLFVIIAKDSFTKICLNFQTFDFGIKWKHLSESWPITLVLKLTTII